MNSIRKIGTLFGVFCFATVANAQVEIYIADDNESGDDLTLQLLDQLHGKPDDGPRLPTCPNSEAANDPLFPHIAGCEPIVLESFADGPVGPTVYSAAQLELGTSVDPTRLDDLFSQAGKVVASAQTNPADIAEPPSDQVLVKTDTIVYAVPKDVVRIKSGNDDGISYNVAGGNDQGYADVCILTERCKTGTDAVNTPAPPSLQMTIQFERNSAILTYDQSPTLDRIVKMISDPYFAGHRFEIVGHTDTSGSINRNIELSKQRADAVAFYLSQNGINADKFTTVGLWFRDLVPFAHPEDPIHRRVTLYSIPPGK